ncbi:MAG: MFS transporter, partial [Actinobacteria bacterium]|nr:MFS transporter [Actinomycetota bacterium]
MVTGAALIGLQRGEHDLGIVAIASGGACVGIAAWHWLGHSRRLDASSSIFLAVIAIGAGTGFTGESGTSVLAIGVGLLVVLALLSALAPFATDLYLPAFPLMTTEFDTTATAVQLTLTAFLVGIAIGQLIFGPLSDRIGRLPPLLIGAA